MINYLQNQRRLFSSGGKLLRAGKLLTLLMLLFVFTGQMKASHDVEVGSASTTNAYVPTYIYYGNTLSQQIYTADEIGQAGVITGMKIHVANGTTRTRKIKVYMANVEKTSFTSSSDWVVFDNNAYVYSANVTFTTNSWVTLNFTTPFEYNGTDNLLICIQDWTNSWENSYPNYYVYSGTSNCTMYEYRDDIVIYPATPNEGSFTSRARTANKNHIKLTFADPAEIALTTTVADLGERPNNAWMQPTSFSLINNGESNGVITGITSNNDYFTVLGEFPMTVNPNETVEIEVTTGTATAGLVEGQLTVTYMDPFVEQQAAVDIAATAYDPVTGDVWENPMNLGTLSINYYNNFEIGTYYTGEDCPYHQNYTLPDDVYYLTMKDVVFKFTMDEDFVLDVWEGGASRALAVYAEDFGGMEGPGTTNCLASGTSQIYQQYLLAGTYYLVCGDSDDIYRYTQISILPVPVPNMSYIYDMDYNTWEGKSGVDNGDQMRIYPGNYSKEMQVLVGTQYPPSTVMLDWTNELTSPYTFVTLEGLSHNTVYFAQVKTRNNTGTTVSNIYPFTTLIDPVENFAAESEEIFVGDTAVFTWDAVRGAFLGYNFYKDGVKQNDELITTNTMRVPDLAYNMGGYTFGVTTVYEAGESAAEEIVVRVSGYATIEGYVFEQDGTTPINNINVTLVGYDEFDNEVDYTFTTDEDGKYEGTFKCGYGINVSVDVEEYQPQNIFIGWVGYNWSFTGQNFVLTETYFPVEAVTAVEEGDNVSVSWTTHSREVQNYRVYRTLASNDGPYTLDNTDVIATPTETSVLDETWADAESGLYKYGVSVVYEGNREGETVPTTLSEGFDEGFPEGWTKMDPNSYGYNWMLGSEAGLGYYKGHNGSKDMMISKSYSYGSAVNHDAWLVTPKVKFTDASEFSFWACAQDANYPTEYFAVYVSTSSNDYVGYFYYVNGWTMTAHPSKAQGDWAQYTVNLGDYAGEEGYVAIRHYSYTSNGFYLDVDDVELRNPSIHEGNESEIVWSDPIGKDMFVAEGVNVKVSLNNPTESPVGATINFINQNEFEQEHYPVADVTLTEDMIVEEYDEVNDITTYYGYVEYTNFRKGYYKMTITREDYDDYVMYTDITEPVEIECEMIETLYNDNVLNVSLTGFATWVPVNDDRAFQEYALQIIDNTENVAYGYFYTTDNFIQLPVEELGLIEGRTYTCLLYSIYTTGWSSSENTTFKYRPCSNFDGVSELSLTSTAEGNTMSWEYPGTSVIDEEIAFDNGSLYSINGYSYWCVKFPVGTIITDNITKVSHYNYSYNTQNIIQIFIYNGDEIDDDNLLFESDEIELPNQQGFMDYEFDEPLEIDNTKDVWVVYHKISGYNYQCTMSNGNGNSGNNYYSNNGYTWYNTTGSYNYMIRLYYELTVEPEGAVVYRDGEIYDFVEEAAFVDNGVFDGHEYGVRVIYTGNIMSCVETASIAEQATTMAEGWNWWSPFIEQENYDGLSILENGLGANGEMIKSQSDGFVSYDEESGEWSGSLTGLTNENMYKVKANGNANIAMFGTVANAADHEITLSNGWTWIGFVSGAPMNINTALAGLQATEGDMIKSQYGFATYDADGGWFGSLKTLTPGYGLMYKSLNEDDVTFVYGSNSKGELDENVGADHWMANYNAYPYNMTMIAVVELNDMEVEGDYELAAFANGECRGSVKLIPVMGRYMAFLTVAGDDAAEFRFALYNADTEEEIYESANVVNFVADAMVGDNVNPYVVSFRGTTGLSEMSDSMTVYPNPVDKGGQISIMLAVDTESMQVEVVNTLGEVVSVETFGQSQANVTMPDMPGVYMVRIVTGNNNTMFRKVVVK